MWFCYSLHRYTYMRAVLFDDLLTYFRTWGRCPCAGGYCPNCPRSAYEQIRRILCPNTHTGFIAVLCPSFPSCPSRCSRTLRTQSELVVLGASFEKLLTALGGDHDRVGDAIYGAKTSALATVKEGQGDRDWIVFSIGNPRDSAKDAWKGHEDWTFRPERLWWCETMRDNARYVGR